jgi:predicted nucleotide-binding protein
MDLSPSGSTVRAVLSSARQYGLTEGTEKADKIALTALGEAATSDDAPAAWGARRRAAFAPEPYGKFFTEFAGRKLASPAVLRKWLEESAGVSAVHAEDAARILLINARWLGLVRPIKGTEYVHLSEDGLAPAGDSVASSDAPMEAETMGVRDAERITELDRAVSASPEPRRSGKVFIGHGKNRTPVDQLKAMMKTLGVEVGVAVDEAHAGRPISQKVAEVMRECTSACFVFTADEKYQDTGGADAWRPSDNAVFELGAAAMLYGKRIVIFRERDVTFASDFSDLGHITFEKDRLDATMTDLLKELVAFGIVEIRAAG